MKLNEIMRKLRPVLLLVSLVILSYSGFGQDPGGNPDGPPPAVPFEDYMNLILLGAGAILAMFVIKKMQKKVRRG